MSLAFAVDSVLEVTAQIARRVNVEMQKQFESIQMTQELFTVGHTVPRGLSLRIEYNEVDPFIVSLYSPIEGEGLFQMESDSGQRIAYYLVNSSTGERYYPGSHIYQKSLVALPCSVEMDLDLVIVSSQEEVNMGEGYWGRIGVKIVEL